VTRLSAGVAGYGVLVQNWHAWARESSIRAMQIVHYRSNIGDRAVRIGCRLLMCMVLRYFDYWSSEYFDLYLVPA